MGNISMEFPDGWGWKFPCRKGKCEGAGGPIWNSLCGRGLDIFWNYTCILYCMNWLVCMFIFYGVTVETENTTVDPYATNSPQISWWHLTLSVLTTCQLVYPLSFTIVYVCRHVGQHPIKCWCGWYTSWHIRWLLGNKSANMSTDCPLTCNRVLADVSTNMSTEYRVTVMTDTRQRCPNFTRSGTFFFRLF